MRKINIMKRIAAGMLSAVVLATSVNYTPVYGAETAKAEESLYSESGYGYGCLPEDMSKVSEDDKIDSVEEYYDTVAEEQLEADGEVSEEVQEAIEDTDAVTADLPSFVDNSQSEYFPAIGDQGSVGSCTTFAQVYYQFTYEMNKQLGRTSKSKANVFAPYFVYNLINAGGNNGTYASDCYDVLMKQGALDFSKYSNETDYTTWTADASKWAEASDYRAASYQYISTETGYSGHYVTSPKDSDLNTIKAALDNGEILTFYSKSRGWIKGNKIQHNDAVPGNDAHLGEFIIPYVVSSIGGHRVTIVGYDDNIWYDINGNGLVEEAEKGAFKMANSWGTNTYGHNGGFAWMSYDLLNNVTQVPNLNVNNRIIGISQIARMTVQPYDNDSDIKLYYTIKTASRYQARIRIKATNKSTGEVKTEMVTPFYTFASESVNLGYAGNAGESTGSMSMDLDNLAEGLNSDNFNDYDWEIEFIDSKNDGYTSTVLSAEIVDANKGITYSLSGNYPMSLNGNSEKATVKGTSYENKTTIYYTNGNWNEAYIHFKTQNGEWTNVPGVKMENSDVEGYTWKYVIDLAQDDSENVQVCFNNGNGAWDSRNAQNYLLNSGVYSIQNGNIETVGLKVTSFEINKPNEVYVTDTQIRYTANAVFGSGDYSYRFGTMFKGSAYYLNNGNYIDTNTAWEWLSDTVGMSYTDTVGTHTLFVEVKDNVTGDVAAKTIRNFVVKPMAITSFTSDATSSVIRVGTDVTFNAVVEGEDGYRYTSYAFTVIKDGVRTPLKSYEYWKHYSRTWTPTETGNYTIEYYVRDGHDQEATATLDFTVVDDNTTTLYYNNDSWSQAYVHYKVNGGEWTSVPGVRMEDTTEQSGYRWKFDFDLGDADGVTVCFNDGNGNWDSRNAQNYYIGTGVYGIKNGSVNNLSE